VLLGAYAGTSSHARTDTPIVGVDVAFGPRDTVLPLHSEFEHALVVTEGSLRIGADVVAPGVLAYLGRHRDEIAVTAEGGTRALLLGGEPFPEQVLMWWNFVARSRDEVELATKDWNSESDRFGAVGSRLARIPAPAVPWRSA
jgi:redox-sensitive bicupin YhaK (pirin superfamily)